MAYEKFGFMLAFWNMAGVPFTYCHCTLYLANHSPETYRWSLSTNIGLYVLLLGSYYIWDTCNSQKNRFRQQMHGQTITRKTFPQLPWGTIQNPTFIKCANGGTLLTSGWCTPPSSALDAARLMARSLRKKTSLYCRLSPVPRLGSCHRIRQPHPLLLPNFLPYRPHPPGQP